MLVEMAAKSLGSSMAANIVLLFYPITRGSVLLQALRLSYPEAIRCAQVCAVHDTLTHAVPWQLRVISIECDTTEALQAARLCQSFR
jgi:hypothetical protein